MSPRPDPELVRREALRDYIRRCAAAVGLTDVKIEVSDKRADPQKVLTIVVNPLRHAATISVGSFFDEDPEEQRNVVAHELVHIPQGRLNDWINEDPSWSRSLAPETAAVIRARVSEEMEVQADRLGRIIAPLLPKPPRRWP